jgi:RimJ/RimL family protein N-acetyltransferase
MATRSPAEHEACFRSLPRRARLCVRCHGVADDRTHIGNVWLWDIDPRNQKADLRVLVRDRGARGSRLGPEAIVKLCRDALESLGLHRIYAYVLGINPSACLAFERAGFAHEGTLRDDRWASGRFIDSDLLARLHG